MTESVDGLMARWAAQMILGEKAYFKAMLEQAEHDPGSVDWAEIDEMMAELQRRDEEVDEAQGERTDWRT